MTVALLMPDTPEIPLGSPLYADRPFPAETALGYCLRQACEQSRVCKKNDRIVSSPRAIVSRRIALLGLAGCAARFPALAEAPEYPAGPVFSPTGPNAELYGALEGFPIADRTLSFNPATLIK